MAQYFTTLTIAGSDCSGGAGVQADLKTFSALGTYGMSVITAVTAQNTTRMRCIMPVMPWVVGSQIDAIMDDIRPDAVKIGMLFNAPIIETVAQKLRKWKPEHVVLDPVMVATSGSRLIDEDAVATLKEQLIPLADVLTPNRQEAEVLSGITISNREDCNTAARKILALGAKAVLIKGGHFDTTNGKVSDLLYCVEMEPEEFSAPFVATRNTHGTGCTLSAAIAAEFALGKTLSQAVGQAKQFLSQALAAGANVEVGHGHGAMNHFFKPMPLRCKE